MKVKKSNKANLEKKKGVFLQIGILVALSVVYMAFEWNTMYKRGSDIAVIQSENDFEEEIINTYYEEPLKEKPMPKPKELVITEEEIEEELILVDTEVDQEEEIEPYIFEPEEAEPEPVPIPPYMCEEAPTFPGGEKAYLEFIMDNTIYPEIAKENNISGVVYISFVVDKKGNITSVKLAKGVDPFLDKEALRVFESMPKWKPGKQNGIAVPVTQMGRINFTLTH